jgi:MerR family transcriptional regulator, copper efflux regulator
LKIGELAQQANVTKRTIDYYTRIGLLTAERSASNYRYYKKETVQLIIEIEQLKKQGLSLQEIAKQLNIEQAQYEEVDIQAIRIHMQELEKEVKLLAAELEKNPDTSSAIKKNVLPESVALMQSLLLLVP